MIGTRFVTHAVVLSLIYMAPAIVQPAAGETKGQASGIRVVRGEVKQASPRTIVIEDTNGKETTMSVDAGTAGDRDVRPGDIITSTITGQGRAVTIHKEAKEAAAAER